MVPFAPVAFRPAVTSPAARRLGQNSSWISSRPAFPMMGRQAPRYQLSQSFDQLFSWSPAVGDTIRLAFHSATAVLGFRVWIKDKGFFKWFGLALALGQTVGAICDVISLVQLAAGTHPPEPPK